MILVSAVREIAYKIVISGGGDRSILAEPEGEELGASLDAEFGVDGGDGFAESKWFLAKGAGDFLFRASAEELC